MRTVVYEREFVDALAAEVDYLRAHDAWDWIVILRNDLEDAAGLIGRFPEAGTELRREGSGLLRRLRLRRAPFFVWYAVDLATPRAPVHLLRLFQVRQRTPAPRMP